MTIKEENRKRNRDLVRPHKITLPALIKAFQQLGRKKK